MRRDREVLWVTLLCAAMATALDAVLLELQRGFFTGGFLARDGATRWADRLVFLLSSLSLDAVLAGIGVLAALAMASRLAWGRAARRVLALGLGAGPVVLSSLLSYQVFARLGDAFDLGLMFDLVGRKPAEILAVSWAELLVPVASICGFIVLAGLALRTLNRRYPSGVRQGTCWPGLLAWAAAAIIVAVATTVTRTTSEVQENGLRRKPSGQVIGAAVTFASDVDRDGFGVLGRPADPAPMDARVFPYALDVPGNGVDEDGIGGDLPVDQDAVPLARRTPVFAQTPPVVLVMLETFRADLVGAHEGGKEITPVLNRLASEGGAAVHAYSHNGYTVQSRHHLFTGALPRVSPTDTLIDDFRRNGYDTAYFSAQDESFGGLTFDIGAEKATIFYDARQDRSRRYTRFTTAGSLGVSSDVVLERVATYLSTRPSTSPLFLYVNFYDTHYPYWHAQLQPLVSDAYVAQADIDEARAGEVRRMYRNAAANVDHAIGELWRLVEARVGPGAVFIVVADHGENLFEDGLLGHGYVINDLQTRIPLIASGLGLDLCEPVGQVDLRAAIGTALARPTGESRPHFRECTGQRVFQYLGTVDRPRQIAFTTGRRRLTYDTREDRVRVDEGPWVPTSALGESQRREWLSLVYYWERLRLVDRPRNQDAS